MNTTPPPAICPAQLAEQAAATLIEIATRAGIATCLSGNAAHAWRTAVAVLDSPADDEEKRAVMGLALDAIASQPGAAAGLLRGIAGALDGAA